MTDMALRNMQMVCTALDKEEIQYFSAPQQLIAYTPCKVHLKNRTLRPTELRVMITPDDAGILIEATLPVTLQTSSEEEHHLILRKIAMENYGNLRGGLTYKPESERLQYRIFYSLGEDAACFDAEEVATCVRLSGTALSDGYEAIINALDEAGSEDADSDDAPENINAELEALFDRLFAARMDAEPQTAPSQEHDSAEAAKNSNADVSGENVDPALRSMLDDFLSEDTDTH